MSASYRDLIAWQKAMRMVTSVYRLTEGFPKHELYGLTNQIRRAAVSVPSNIAEGQGRNSRGEFLQFLGTSKGSLLELETQIMIAQDLGYCSEAQAVPILGTTDDVARLIGGLKKPLQRQSPKTG